VKKSQVSLEARITTIYGMAADYVNKPCQKYVVPTLCYYGFPPCDLTSKKPKPRKFCQDDCYTMQYDVCRAEFDNFKRYLPNSNTLPDCAKLPSRTHPDYKTCIRVIKKGEELLSFIFIIIELRKEFHLKNNNKNKK
jgi:hypothetical protein